MCFADVSLLSASSHSFIHMSWDFLGLFTMHDQHGNRMIWASLCHVKIYVLLLRAVPSFFSPVAVTVYYLMKRRGWKTWLSSSKAVWNMQRQCCGWISVKDLTVLIVSTAVLYRVRHRNQIKRIFFAMLFLENKLWSVLQRLCSGCRCMSDLHASKGITDVELYIWIKTHAYA